MTSHGSVEVLLADLGRDAVAQQQLDGRVVVAVRPDQSFANAVDKAREAIEKASGTAISADVLRQLLRPHWTSRQTFEDLLAEGTAEQQRQRGEQVADDLVPEPALPVSVREPLRRGVVQAAVALSCVALLAVGFTVGWTAKQIHRHGVSKEVVLGKVFEGPLAEAFRQRGVQCDELGGGRATCVDSDGTNINIETLVGAKQTAYSLFYADEVVTLRKFDRTEDAGLWAQRDAGARDMHEYVTGPHVMYGTDDARVHRYVHFMALKQHLPVFKYTGDGPPTIVYRPGQKWLDTPTDDKTPGAA